MKPMRHPVHFVCINRHERPYLGPPARVHPGDSRAGLAIQALGEGPGRVLRAVCTGNTLETRMISSQALETMLVIPPRHKGMKPPLVATGILWSAGSYA
jgi:hypothetical protein